MRYVVDASIVYDWLIPENAAALSRALWERFRGPRPDRVHAPLLLQSEVVNTVVRDELKRGQAASLIRARIRTFAAYPIYWQADPLPATRLAELRLAGLTGQDATYVAFAQVLRLPLATVDERLARVLRAWRGGPALVALRD
jgi:predicted nucleic acid-binding protein